MRTVCLLYGCQCNACCDRIEQALRRVRGVRNVEVNLYKATATVEHSESCEPRQLVEAVEHTGYLASIVEPPRPPAVPPADPAAPPRANGGTHG
ncbi:MAG: heavy-metal-associated domain-containing protein [Phycisphaerales bacterium]|nr:heavy-metal-associated domain-containing protein [Phycisphaerales bacterium]